MTSPARVIPRRAVAAWVLYDLANTVFSMGVVSIYFSLYVRDAVGTDRADTTYSIITAISMGIIFVVSPLAAHLANQLGWISAELGRQPWVVYGLLRTQESVSKSITGGMVLGSIIMFGVIYAALFAVYVFVLNEKIQHGPEGVSELPPETGSSNLVEAAARLANPAGYSLSGARSHEDEPDHPRE